MRQNDRRPLTEGRLHDLDGHLALLVRDQVDEGLPSRPGAQLRWIGPKVELAHVYCELRILAARDQEHVGHYKQSQHNENGQDHSRQEKCDN